MGAANYNHCINCMTQTGGLSVCPACAYDLRDYHHHPLYLTPYTRLKDQYRVGKVLGQGGFGITYLGLDEQLDKRVAIKEYLPSMLATRDTSKHNVIPLADQQAAFSKGLRSFIDEARNLAKFDHPNIVRVINYFEENQTGYMVMEYLEGESPVDLIKEQGGALPLKEALDIMLPILDALQTVHARHVYHLDVSAHNIRFDKARQNGGKPILIDFGAAKNIMGDYSHSMTLVLKPGYSPLEQYADSGRIGPWTDIYACGALFYLMLTGMLPPAAPERFYEDRLWDMCEQRDICLPENLKAVLDRAMSVKLETRYSNIAAFAQALMLALANESDTAMFNNTFRQSSQNRDVSYRSSLYATGMMTIMALLIAGWLMRDAILPNGLYIDTNTSQVGETVTPTIVSEVPVSESPPPTLQVDIAELLVQGEQAFSTEKFDDAYQNYQAVLSLDADNPSAKLALTQLVEHDIQRVLSHRQRGDWPTALRTVQQGLNRFPENLELQALHAELTDPDKIQQHEIERLARKAETQATALKLTDPTGDNAYETYQQILGLSPDSDIAHTGLEKLADRYLVLAQESNNSEAQLDYVNKGLNIAPIHQALQNLKQTILAKAAQQETLTTVTPPVTRENSLQKFLSRAEQHLRNDELNSAYNNYRSVLALEPDNLTASQGLQQVADRYAELAEIQQAANRLSESLLLVARGLTAWPNHPPLMALQETITRQLDAVSINAEVTEKVADENTILVTPSF